MSTVCDLHEERIDEGLMDASTAVDEEVVAQLKRELGDEALLQRLATTYLSDLDARVTAMLTAADPQEAQRAAHSLKSGSRLLGAGRFAEVCEAVEHGEVPAACTAGCLDRAAAALREAVSRSVGVRH